MVGTVLGDRYEIVARLARGGMATVYRAIDHRLNRTVALKLMHEGLGEDADYVRRFDREAKAAARLSHPNVVSVFDQGHDQGRPYIVMEYVEGSTLRPVASHQAPLPPLQALEYIEPVAKALAAAHEAGLIHRDIKPENVLITNRSRIKVADFGLAKAITGQTATATQGLLIGTVSYLPPELVTSGSATSASDVYSTGVVLFELLTGTKPHTGETPIQVAYSHVNEDVPPPSSRLTGRLRAQIPDYLDALVTACTSRRPELRPADGRALVARIAMAKRALQAGVASDPELARRLGGGPELDLTGATVVTSPVSPRSPVTSATPTEPSLPGIRRTDPIPLSPLSPGDSAASRRTARPLVHVSQDPVHRRRRGLAIALLLVLLVGLAGGGTGWWWLAEGRWTTTPPVVGMSGQDANAAAVAANLGFESHTEYSETVVAGQVIRTQPDAGQRILRDGTVIAYLSLGPERYPMPKVVGMALDEAKTALTDGRLAVGSVTEDWNETADIGTVVSASSDPGTQLKRDTAINLVISKGPQPIAITDYTGKGADDATAGLQGAGFTVTRSDENSATVPAGSVVSQSPATGNGKKGDTVTIVVSKGPVMVAIPDVRGKSTATAVSQLKDLGFAVTTKYLVSGGLALGLAYGTEPGSGTSVAQGSAVTVLIG